jgi:hypothetical protein
MEAFLKKAFITGFLLITILISFSLISPQLVFCDNPSESLSTDVPIKAPKKNKKKHKKSKSGKVKVSKSSTGPQDEISDQTDVSQQADSTENKKKR